MAETIEPSPSSYLSCTKLPSCDSEVARRLASRSARERSSTAQRTCLPLLLIETKYLSKMERSVVVNVLHRIVEYERIPPAPSGR